MTLNAPDDWNDHRILLDRAFAPMKERILIKKGQQVGTLEVPGCRPCQIPVLSEADFILGAREGERAAVILPGPGFLYGPVEAGESLGQALVLISGTPAGKIPVCAGFAAAHRGAIND